VLGLQAGVGPPGADVDDFHWLARERGERQGRPQDLPPTLADGAIYFHR
jgi:hypothetical protein